jgi:hypothetical protein
LTEEEWRERFQPNKNQFDPNANYGGTLFDIGGAEYDFIKSVWADSPNSIWTLLECDGQWTIVSGWHFVNRIGYFFCSVPFADHEDFEVPDDIDTDDGGDEPDEADDEAPEPARPVSEG